MSREAALADFGTRALSASDIDELLLEACTQLANACGAEFAKFVEIQPRTRRLVVKTAVNMLPGTIGAVLPGDRKSAPGYAIQSGYPVIAPDVAAERRYAMCAVVKAHKVRSLCNVLVRTKDGPFGVLEVDSLEAATLGADG